MVHALSSDSLHCSHPGHVPPHRHTWPAEEHIVLRDPRLPCAVSQLLQDVQILKTKVAHYPPTR